jgi:hypothetical protein
LYRWYQGTPYICIVSVLCYCNFVLYFVSIVVVIVVAFSLFPPSRHLILVHFLLTTAPFIENNKTKQNKTKQNKTKRFVGGVASSFTPSVFKKRNRQQQQKKKNKDRIDNWSKDSSALTMSDDLELDDLDEEGEEENENINTGSDDVAMTMATTTTIGAPSAPADTNSGFLSFKKFK